MTATFSIPNQAVDNPGVYFPKNDGNWALAQPMVGLFACHEAATPNMTVLVDAGLISFMGQTPTLVSQQTISGFVAPVSNPRKDLIVINSNTGVASKVAGTENASPVDPAVPAGSIPIARISFATSTTTITNALITDLRATVLATQGPPATLSISTNTTLTLKQAGIDVLSSGYTAITLPSAVNCAGSRYRFIGADSSSQQAINASVKYPDGRTASSISLQNDEIVELISNGALWLVLNRQTPQTAIPVGTILLFSGGLIPDGWKSCDGSAISRVSYASLFAVISTLYGVGDGSTTFNLPDTSGCYPVGVGVGGGNPSRIIATKGGSSDHTTTGSGVTVPWIAFLYIIRY